MSALVIFVKFKIVQIILNIRFFGPANIKILFVYIETLKE